MLFISAAVDCRCLKDAPSRNIYVLMQKVHDKLCEIDDAEIHAAMMSPRKNECVGAHRCALTPAKCSWIAEKRWAHAICLMGIFLPFGQDDVPTFGAFLKGLEEHMAEIPMCISQLELALFLVFGSISGTASFVQDEKFWGCCCNFEAFKTVLVAGNRSSRACNRDPSETLELAMKLAFVVDAFDRMMVPKIFDDSVKLMGAIVNAMKQSELEGLAISFLTHFRRRNLLEQGVFFGLEHIFHMFMVMCFGSLNKSKPVPHDVFGFARVVEPDIDTKTKILLGRFNDMRSELGNFDANPSDENHFAFLAKRQMAMWKKAISLFGPGGQAEMMPLHRATKKECEDAFGKCVEKSSITFPTVPWHDPVEEAKQKHIWKSHSKPKGVDKSKIGELQETIDLISSSESAEDEDSDCLENVGSTTGEL